MFKLLKKISIASYQLGIVKIFVINAIPFFFYDTEILFLINSFLFLHFRSGIKTILKDYFHSVNLIISIILFLRVLILEFLRYILEFFL